MPPHPAIDAVELHADLEALGGFGASGERGGVSRLAFGPADMDARDWVEAQMARFGMTVRRDAIGNTIGALAGLDPDLPPIALGSHTDSVPDGGRYDGALGVIGALAAVRSLTRSGTRLRHPVEVINFVAEEATVGGGLLGSRAMTGQLPAGFAELPAWGRSTVGAHLAAVGIDPAAVAAAQRAPGMLRAYLELHIEQGPILERAGVPIGLVDRISAIRSYRGVCTGVAGHAGTTPMLGRADALVGAARFVTGVPDIALRHDIVATVGQLIVEPGGSNVIPGRVEFTLDVRGPSELDVDAAEADLAAALELLGGALTLNTATPPVRLDTMVAAVVERAATDRGWAVRRMPCGAGHDAMCLAAITRAALIFVPSRAGISHSPAEFTAPEECAAGAQVLLDTLVALDRQDINEEACP